MGKWGGISNLRLPHRDYVPGEKHIAKVKEISPVVDPSSGTFEVLVALSGDHGAFHPGMTANLKVEKPR